MNIFAVILLGILAGLILHYSAKPASPPERERIEEVELYKHIKSGKQYLVIDYVEDCTNARSGNMLVLYCSVDDTARVFVRDLAEFNSKFVHEGKVLIDYS